LSKQTVGSIKIKTIFKQLSISGGGKTISSPLQRPNEGTAKSLSNLEAGGTHVYRCLLILVVKT
jgi:hypothetical protein